LWKAIVPTSRSTGEPFRLCLKGEDRWGNPSDLCDGTFALKASTPVDGLPDTVTFEPGRFSVIVDDLAVHEPGDLLIVLVDGDGRVVARSNPLRIESSLELRP